MCWLCWLCRLCWLWGFQRHVHIHRWFKFDTRAKLEAQSSRSAMVWSAEKHRARNLRKQYGLNALGKFVRKRSFRDIDYTDEGHLQQFDNEDGWIAFEAERHAKGDTHPTWSAKARDTVPKEQLALPDARERERESEGERGRGRERGRESRERERRGAAGCACVCVCVPAAARARIRTPRA